MKTSHSGHRAFMANNRRYAPASLEQHAGIQDNKRVVQIHERDLRAALAAAAFLGGLATRTTFTKCPSG